MVLVFGGACEGDNKGGSCSFTTSNIDTGKIAEVQGRGLPGISDDFLVKREERYQALFCLVILVFKLLKKLLTIVLVGFHSN